MVAQWGTAQQAIGVQFSVRNREWAAFSRKGSSTAHVSLRIGRVASSTPVKQVGAQSPPRG